MNKLFFLISLPTIAFLSCDGRDRAYKTNAEVLKASHLFDDFSKQIKFVPKANVEIYTDTILSSGFQVKLKYNSLENDYVSKTMKSKNDTLIDVNYKNFEAQFLVIKDQKLVTEKIINKTLFSKFENQEFWKSAIMQFVWIDYESSTENHVLLNTSFCIPETEVCKDFTIIIDNKGSIHTKEINLIANTL